VRVLLVDMARACSRRFPRRRVSTRKRNSNAWGRDRVRPFRVEVEERAIRFADRGTAQSRAVIWAAGVREWDTGSRPSGESRPGGRVRVTPDLRLLESSNVWAVGDAAAVPLDDKTFCPQLRQLPCSLVVTAPNKFCWSSEVRRLAL